MDEMGARTLMERLSVTEQPPSRVDIPLARRRGARRLRRRRWAAGVAPLLAAAAVVAVVAGTGALSGGDGPGKGGTHAVSPRVSVRHRFNPLAPYAAFGWLPKGDPRTAKSPSSTPTQLQLMAGSAAEGQFSLTVWAPGTCNLGAAQVLAALRKHHHPLLNCAQDADAGWAATLSRTAPAVAGRPGFWFEGHMLAWEYAPRAWATLYVSRRGAPLPAATIVTVAAHVRYAATTAASVKFPYQFTGVPKSWRVMSVDWRATAAGLVTTNSKELGDQAAVGTPNGRVTGTIGQIVVSPGKSKCWFDPHGSQRITLGAVKAIYTLFRQPGVRSYQGLCVPETDGLSVFFLVFRAPGSHAYPLGGATGVFLHHLRLLGPDPANWTTRPLSP
jgi:hypothetical protein